MNRNPGVLSSAGLARMKLTVWTTWNTRKPMDEGRPKCIFIGESDTLPRIGEYVVCRDGFCCERVEMVSIDLVRKEAEIKVATCDPNGEYGPCLLRANAAMSDHADKNRGA